MADQTTTASTAAPRSTASRGDLARQMAAATKTTEPTTTAAVLDTPPAEGTPPAVPATVLDIAPLLDGRSDATAMLRAAIDALFIRWEHPTAQQSEVRTNARDGSKNKRVMIALVEMSPILAPGVLTPINIYARQSAGSRRVTYTANVTGVTSGAGTRPFFKMKDGGDPTSASAPVMEYIVRAYIAYKDTDAAKAAAKPALLAKTYELDGGETDDFDKL